MIYAAIKIDGIDTAEFSVGPAQCVLSTKLRSDTDSQWPVYFLPACPVRRSVTFALITVLFVGKIQHKGCLSAAPLSTAKPTPAGVSIKLSTSSIPLCIAFQITGGS